MFGFKATTYLTTSQKSTIGVGFNPSANNESSQMRTIIKTAVCGDGLVVGKLGLQSGSPSLNPFQGFLVLV